tara:strand:- start:1566 stop:3566 length:2001 start_codon:yes stop_codon:yes gene_type:complete
MVHDHIEDNKASFEKGKNIIFVEKAEQVNLFKNYFEKTNFKNEYQIVAIGPSAQSSLIKFGIPYFKSDFFFKNYDHINVLKKADEIISFMRNNFVLSDCIGVRHAYEREIFSFLRYYYLNYCISLLLIIHNSVKILQPKKVIFPKSISPKDLTDATLSHTSLLGYLGELYAISNNLHFELEGDIVKTVTSGKYKTITNPKYKSFKLLSDLFHRLMFNAQLITYKFFSRNKNIIYAPSAAYNVPRVMDYLSKKIKNPFSVGGTKLSGIRLFLSILLGENGQFLRFPPPSSKKKLNDFLDDYDKAIKKIEKYIGKNNDIFTINKVSLKELIIDHLNNGLKNKVKNTFFGSLAFDKILKIKEPAFLLANQASGYHYAIGEQCKNKNINAMLVSHGTHVPHQEKWVKKEWNEHARFMINTHFPYVAVQTPWAEKFLSDGENSISKPIVTGPLLYAKDRCFKEKQELKKILFPNHYEKKIILHAASPFGWFVFHPYVNLTHDEYISHINDLIRSVEKMDDVFLAIRIRLKSFGFNNMSLNDIKRLLIKSECYEIFVEGSFEDYLLCSDLLVSFSSTTIEEALQLKIPVLQYDPFNRYSHIPSKSLVKESKNHIAPIYYVPESHNLSWGLDWIKKNHLDINDSDLKINWSEHKIQFSENWISSIISDITLEN